jgi:hypothetical protein
MRDEFNQKLLIKSNQKRDSEEFGIYLERSWLDGILPAEKMDDQDLNDLYRYGG